RAEMLVKQINFLMGGAEEPDAGSQGNNDRGFNPFDPFGRSFSRSRSSQSSEHEDKFRVSADVKNNSLILWCNEFELRKVEDLIEQLQGVPDTGGGDFEVHVYRLNTLDPEPLVSTLQDMDALGVHASLKADKESKSIVAYATVADHKKIEDLIARLDSSGRKFEVVQLRRLQADYVAGTVEFMMGAAEEKQQSSSRYYFDYYPMNRGDKNKDDKSGFKVDADVENNRLLLLANAAEMEEVTNLLVKLGEIPAEGGDPSTVRVLDTLPGPELEKLLKQVEKAWPSVAPNPLLLPDPGTSPKKEEAEPAPATDKKDARPGTAQSQPASPLFRFAQQETTKEESAAGGAAERESARPVLGQPEVPTGKTDAAGPVSPQSGEPDEETAGTATTPEKAKADGAGAAVGTTKAANAAGPASAPAGMSGGQTAAGDKAPVSITVGPDGRLVISSEDTRALDRLEELLSNLAPAHPDYQIYQLKYAYASTVALNLEDIFEDKKEESGSRSRFSFYDYYGGGNDEKDEKVRLSQRRPLKFISDYSSNSILVQNADPGQLRVISEVIEFYDQPEPSDSQSVRKTEVVAVKYSKASVIAETVKDVYRDLLSANDKALANNQQKNTPERSYTYVYDSADSDEERKTPSFKGMLSLGVDDLSNTLIVSAPAYFISDVLQVIEDLDLAAEPKSETVEIISVKKGVSAPELQKTLMKILQERSAGKPKESKKPSQNDRPDQGRSPGGGGPERR
ncbi:MAG: secretin N-terminal domain-containing protein, partial [Thermoguttaceae bacterium]